MYNFLDLSPGGQRYIYQLILQFDLATEQLCNRLESSTIPEVRKDMFLEGFRRVRSLVVTYGEGVIPLHLVETQGKELLELNSAAQFFVMQYEHSTEVAKEWLIEVMEVPLWLVRSQVEEQAMRHAAMRTEEEIAQFFADRQDHKAHPLTLEVSAA